MFFATSLLSGGGGEIPAALPVSAPQPTSEARSPPSPPRRLFSTIVPPTSTTTTTNNSLLKRRKSSSSSKQPHFSPLGCFAVTLVVVFLCFFRCFRLFSQHPTRTKMTPQLCTDFFREGEREREDCFFSSVKKTKIEILKKQKEKERNRSLPPSPTLQRLLS